MVLTCVRACCHHFRRNYHSSKEPHRLSRYLLSGAKPNVREDSTISFELLRQYGFMDIVFSGFNIMLPMCARVIDKLTGLINSEMEAIGCQRMVLPSLGPIELLQKSGKYGPNRREFYNLEDRRNEKWYLAPTHEEIISHWISKETITEKKLPLMLYQIGSKFRDEKRPRSGLLRSKEFIMKDLYTFDADEEKAKVTYDLVNESYLRIFSKLGLNIFKVRADPGNIGGILSHEYHLRTNAGEDKILICESCKEGFSEGYSLTTDGKLDKCISCGAELKETLSLELGHTFILGTRYSKPFNCIYTKFEGKRSYLEMGCYGLGISRIMAACLEAFPTRRTLTWPKIIAPYLVCLVTPKKGSKEERAGVQALAEDLASYLTNNYQLDLIIDDRRELTIGHRLFEDTCWGFPYILIAGKKAMQDIPIFELIDTHAGTTRDLTHSQLCQFFATTYQFL